MNFRTNDTISEELHQRLTEKFTHKTGGGFENGRRSKIEWLRGTIKGRATDELSRLAIVIKNCGGLKTFLQNTMKRKGVIDGGSKWLNLIFGVATTEVVENVRKHVDRLSTQSSAIVQELEAHTFLIKDRRSRRNELV